MQQWLKQRTVISEIYIAPLLPRSIVAQNVQRVPQRFDLASSHMIFIIKKDMLNVMPLICQAYCNCLSHYFLFNLYYYLNIIF